MYIYADECMLHIDIYIYADESMLHANALTKQATTKNKTMRTCLCTQHTHIICPRAVNASHIEVQHTAHMLMHTTYTYIYIYVNTARHTETQLNAQLRIPKQYHNIHTYTHKCSNRCETEDTEDNAHTCMRTPHNNIYVHTYA